MDRRILKTESLQDTKVCVWPIGVLGGNVSQGHLYHSEPCPWTPSPHQHTSLLCSLQISAASLTIYWDSTWARYSKTIRPLTDISSGSSAVSPTLFLLSRRTFGSVWVRVLGKGLILAHSFNDLATKLFFYSHLIDGETEFKSSNSLCWAVWLGNKNSVLLAFGYRFNLKSLKNYKMPAIGC